ncbi:ferrochelatase [Trueperella bialowiezensis]|uniref:Coproporphyrin III ferrochelatase n=1 Tax=Trueperella bialowiezensis TaxID=312285 RepID=A0A3S4X5Z6_9ACTO|nr:ferrochelatase [Trueperella bialowiezensis]VEI13382.1 Ferrochelatase [Trueperella bialowiezensis]
MTDAYMIVSYGGPDKPDDVVPFLRNAVAGKGIPDERLEEVGEHYFLFGGKSPINELNSELAQNLREELARRGDTTPVVVGNRNWLPYGNDVLRELYDAGARSVRAIATSAYGSYSSCRQYREDLARWLGELDLPEMDIDKVPPFWDTEAFFRAYRDSTARALREAPDGSRVLFVTHSVPTAMNEASGVARPLTYEGQHLSLARRIADSLGIAEWDMTYCSRSGSPRTPWLEPDVNDHIESLAERGVTSVVIVPIGFISDHMEVIYDLDTQAKETCDELGIAHHRAATVGTDPQFISALADLLQAPEHPTCAASCCWAGAKEPAVPAL